MTFLLNPHLDLTTQIIETPRCLIVPFSTDGRVDIRELTEEFCKANKDLLVSPFLPTYEQELDFVEQSILSMKQWEIFENFILEKWSNRLIGAIGLRSPEEHRMNLWFWIREDEHGKWYATEAYMALIDWAKQNTRYSYLKHALDPCNIASRKIALRFNGILQDEIDKKGGEIYHIPLR